MNEITQVPAVGVSPMVAMIERIALDPSIPIEKLERMLAMQESIQQAAAKAAFASAFAAASSEFPHIPLNGTGDKGKRYALLKDIMGLTRPVLSRHGLALSFAVNSEGDRVRVTAELMHVDGYTKTTSLDLPKDQSGSKNAVQAVGSSQTYGQRYTAQALLGLSLGEDTDDDGAGETITADQFFELRNLMDQSGADEAKFLSFLKVARLDDLPASQFGQALSSLRQKLKQKQGA